MSETKNQAVLSATEYAILKTHIENIVPDLGYGYIAFADVDNLEQKGLIQVNRQIENETGFAARLTAEGEIAFNISPEEIESSEAWQADTSEEAVIEQQEIVQSVEEVVSESAIPETEKASVEPTNQERYSEDAFAVDKNIPVPSIVRKKKSSKQYPFDKLEVGDSFHIKATEEKPNPQKNMSSLVSSRNKSLADTNVRFSLRRVDASDPRGEGVRVFRIS